MVSPYFFACRSYRQRKEAEASKVRLSDWSGCEKNRTFARSLRQVNFYPLNMLNIPPEPGSGRIKRAGGVLPDLNSRSCR